MEAVIDLDRHRNIRELRATWQGRMLRATRREHIGAAVLSMLCHAYDADNLLVLLKVVFPGFQSIATPFLSTAGKVDKTGAVVADIIDKQERVLKDQPIFSSLGNMQDECRRLADRMTLTDKERLEFFTIATRWVVADRRLDPNMNPMDPDAKRLVSH